MKYRIKVTWGYYPNNHNAPKDGYLTGEPTYDSRTGRETTEPLTFDSVQEAVDFLTSEHDGFTHGTGCEHDGNGEFSIRGTYVTKYGQHSRPSYTIVSAKSGRCNKAILSELLLLP